MLSGLGGEKEFEVDGERSLLDRGSEIPARLLGIVGVEGGEGVERSKQIWRVSSRFQNLLQLPRKAWSERNRHGFSIFDFLVFFFFFDFLRAGPVWLRVFLPGISVVWRSLSTRDSRVRSGEMKEENYEIGPRFWDVFRKRSCES